MTDQDGPTTDLPAGAALLLAVGVGPPPTLRARPSSSPSATDQPRRRRHRGRRHRHEQSGTVPGLDGALKTLRDQPFGARLPGAVALGLMAYRVVMMVRSKYQRR